MKSHDLSRIVFAQAPHNWRAFPLFMLMHENYYIKRAGVAGIRARGFGVNRGFGPSMSGGHGHFLGLVVRACVVVRRCVSS
ncbi:hypothetical protein ASV31_05795 [Enterobacter hormaechei subsp. hoffmannii]|nr:hypothetical protein ASV31_05795 [Enterobacter hormaechei subsp. hoffmannii]RBO35943.1 hypothetical protein DPF97_12230 [Enterobacter hormaechei]KTJ78660.1 hypothetical protein ASU76_18245 [Enterobacter hormaechei subsp. hoffmannii]KTK07773.1 hypothetical protein ASU67_13915 [Enterobacter hormaechei subsp. hoffmannii]KVI92652.1 hypothetical protein AWS42_23500 [Enterobacter hormaechei subsp. hoffmannii]